MHAATSRTSTASAANGAMRARTGRRRVTRSWLSISGDGGIDAGIPGMAAGDPPGAHPAPAQEPVAHDGLLGIARARGFEPARRRHVPEHHPVETGETHPDHTTV